MWLFQNNHITIAILVAAFHWWHDNFFVNGRAKHWRKRICRARRQLISSITSSSTQCQSNTRLYSVERENISTWKKFNWKVNTWNGIWINLRSVFCYCLYTLQMYDRPQILFHRWTLQNWNDDIEDPEPVLSQGTEYFIVNLEKRTSLIYNVFT